MIPEALTAGATLAGAAIDYFGTRQAAREQMKFQKDMSNTAYQRQLEDLRQAGLNPAMVYNLGGASSPSGSAFKTDVGDKLAGMTHSALAAKKMREEYETTKALSEKTRAEAQTIKEMLPLNKQRTAAENLLTQQQVLAQLYQNAGLKFEAAIDESLYGKGARVIKRALPIVSSATDVMGMLRPKTMITKKG